MLPLVALLTSCSEDFEVAAPYKPVTVIYGLLDVADTAHYIRIQKAFLDENKSAIDMALNADSNFYSDLSVHLKEMSGTSLVFDETLPRVDLNLEGHRKDSGVFFNAPNFAYKSKRVLQPGLTYRLVVTNNATGEVDSAETQVIENKPTAQGLYVYEFVSTFQISFSVQQETNKFGFLVQVPPYSQIYEGIIRFHYANRDAAGVMRRDSVDWTFATATREGSKPAIELTTLQRSFYYFLQEAIGPAPANVERYIDSADLFVWAGSEELARYQLINGARGGITADQIKPLYTNIRSNRGNNALGLFTSRTHQEYRGVGIDQRSLDSLMRNSITSSLNFRGRTAD